SVTPRSLHSFPTRRSSDLDAICAPLVHKSKEGKRNTLGAVHVYLEDGRFRQSDFDFIITVANLVTIALVRARELSSLQTDYQRRSEEHTSELQSRENLVCR